MAVPGTNPCDQDAPHYQGAPYRQSELRSDAPAAQHEDPLVRREPPGARRRARKRRMRRTASSGKKRMPRTAGNSWIVR